MADYFNMNPATGKPYDDAWINKNGAGAWLSQGGTTWDAGSSQDGGRTAMQLAPGQLLPGQTQPSPSTGWYGNTQAGTAGPGSPGYVPQQYGAPGAQGSAMTGQAAPATGYAPPQQAQPAPFNQAGGGATTASGNPYLSGQADNITRRMTDNFNRNVMPQYGQAAQQAGGYGGSRQGVLEANGMRDLNYGIGDALTGMYSNDWNQSKGRELSRYGMDQNFYTAERTGDRADVALGAGLMTQGQNGQWGGIQNAAQAYQPFTGLGTTTNNQSSGGGVQGALGGALGAAQLGKNMGWWGGSNNYGGAGITGGGGFGTGSAWGNQDYGSFF